MTTPRARGRLSLRAQIILTILLVGAVQACVGMVQTYYAHREASRGAFLQKHYNRFDEYRHGLGTAMAANAAVIARSFDWDATLAVEAPPDVPSAETTPTATQAPALTRMVARAARALDDTIDPDLFLVVDAAARPIRAPGTTEVSDAEAARSRLLRDALDGLTVAGELARIEGHVYQVGATPLRASDAADAPIVGAVVVGRRLLHYLHDYQLQSDPNEEKQHRLSLLGNNGNVLESVFPSDAWGGLAEALQENNWGEAVEGDDTVDVVELGGHVYDFQREEVRGYDGTEYGTLGAFFLMRVRDFKADTFWSKAESSFWTIGLVAIFTVLLGWLLALRITRRIARFVEATKDLAQGQGDLTRRLSVDRDDELGHLAANLNAVFAHIHDLAARVQRAAFQVGASSAEISAASRQMLDGAQEQAVKTESSTAAVTELSASIQQVAENATEATRVARSSGDAVSKAIDRMNDIRATVDEAAARIHELGESGKRIGNIVEVIRQISDQTTLLALNAAIEAAHAGEQGRGFAVVADEVSGLATRVGQSARDIEELIATIKEQTVDAVRAMEVGTSEVDEGTRLVSQTLTDLQRLVGVVEDTARAVQEQALASDEIARNMDAVQRIAREVLTSSEEAVDQGEHLHRLADGLEQSVKGFRIDPAREIGSGLSEGSRPALTAGSSSGSRE